MVNTYLSDCGGGKLNFIPQSIPDVILIEPTILHGDGRGLFYRDFQTGST